MPIPFFLFGLACLIAAPVAPAAEGRPTAPSQADGLPQVDHFAPYPQPALPGTEAQLSPLGSSVTALPTTEDWPAASAPLLRLGETAMPWKPQSNKYLLLFCGFGRTSNQVRCLKNTFRLAVLLNRTLLLPPKNYVFFRGVLQEEWRLDTLLDINRMAQCLQPAYGPNTVMTFEQYLHRTKSAKVVVGRIRCALPGPPEECAHPTRLQAMLHAVGPTLSLPPLSDYPTWLDPSPLPADRPAHDSEVIAAFGSVPDQLLCVGEVFGIMYDAMDVLEAGVLARPEECNNLWRPHPAISRFIDGVIRESFKGEGFAAMHLRRGDFYLASRNAHRLKNVGSWYYNYSPITDVAQMAASVLKKAGLTALYLATDASKVEVEVFGDVLRGILGDITVITPQLLYESRQLLEQPWAQGALKLAKASATGLPWILTDKGIASQGSIFLGTEFSSFTEDILEMRCDERRLHGIDSSSYLCSSTGCIHSTCG